LLQRSNNGKNPKKICCWLWGYYRSFWQERWCTIIERICYLLPKPTCPFGKLVAKVFGHASKSLSCFSKLKVNGSIYHPFIGFQNHGTIFDFSFSFFFSNVTTFDLWMFKSRNDTFALWLTYKLIMGTSPCDSKTFWSHWYNWSCNGDVS